MRERIVPQGYQADYFFQKVERTNFMTSGPLVSVIMSMQNASATVRDTILSLQWQTLKDWELILFDDGSTDNSSSIVSKISDPRIRLTADGERRGLAARLNQAVAMARGRFVARIDADDVCFPTRLERQVAYLELHPEIDLVASRAVVFSNRDPIGILAVGTSHNDLVRYPFRGFRFPHPTWCGRVEWFRANPYDASLAKTQDQDLLLRSYRHSTFGGLQEVLVGYRQHRLEIKKLLRGRIIFIQSLWRYGRALGPLPAVFAGMASHFIKAIVDTATLSVGLNRWQQKRRLEIVPTDVRKLWLQLYTELKMHSKA